MATSRKRERELARRRFERRRQQELARRAKAKRRNTVIGSSLATLLVIGGVIGLIVGLSGGSSKKPAAKPSASPSSTPVPAPTKCATINPNPPSKGQLRIPPVTGKVPTKLVIKDVKVGHGRAAKAGDSITTDYIGVSCDTGKVFDATYLHPSQPEVVSPLGQANVIPGWNQGLVGIRQGGVRELIIPAALAYGSRGSGSIEPNDTLIFLITAQKVKKG